MALPITLLFLVISMLSPADLAPGLAPMRPLLILTGIAMLASLMTAMQDMRSLLVPQLPILLAFYAMLSISRVLNGWYGGGYDALLTFAPQFFTVILVMLSANSGSKIRWVYAALLFVSVYYMVQGWLALAFGIDLDKYSVEQWKVQDAFSGEVASFRRTKGLGYLDDPNDLAQFYLASIPFVWFWWQKGQFLRNMLLVAVPTALLFLGLYQTASRGSLIGLTILLAFALKRRFGWAGSLLSVGFAAFLALVTGYGGGRGYSVSSDWGGGRVEIWSDALGFFRSSPIWGVGFGMLDRHMPMTAHNAFLLCITELGVVGACIWLSLIVISILQMRRVAALEVTAPKEAGLARLGRTVLLSLTGWISAAWFLSSCYSVTLYVYMGLTAAVWLEARRRVPELEEVPFTRVLSTTLATLFAGLALVYVLVRMRWAG
jgi:O-antigen ligase